MKLKLDGLLTKVFGESINDIIMLKKCVSEILRISSIINIEPFEHNFKSKFLENMLKIYTDPNEIKNFIIGKKLQLSIQEINLSMLRNESFQGNDLENYSINYCIYSIVIYLKCILERNTNEELKNSINVIFQNHIPKLIDTYDNYFSKDSLKCLIVPSRP